jgi:hypothetical protein
MTGWQFAKSEADLCYPSLLSTMDSLKARLAWLGRTPLRYKLLFTTQVCFLLVAVPYRSRIIERKRQELLAQEAQVNALGDMNKT